MTLDDLRERLKAAYEAASLVPQGFGKPRYQDLNMRQAWVENHKLIHRFLEAGDPVEKVLPRALVNFHKAGELYYYAKKHGLQSAMLMRLSGS